MRIVPRLRLMKLAAFSDLYMLEARNPDVACPLKITHAGPPNHLILSQKVQKTPVAVALY